MTKHEAKLELERTFAPICGKCGEAMSHYATLPKSELRPRTTIFRCDRCGATTATPRD